MGKRQIEVYLFLNTKYKCEGTNFDRNSRTKIKNERAISLPIVFKKEVLELQYVLIYAVSK